MAGNPMLPQMRLNLTGVQSLHTYSSIVPQVFVTLAACPKLILSIAGLVSAMAQVHHAYYLKIDSHSETYVKISMQLKHWIKYYFF